MEFLWFKILDIIYFYFKLNKRINPELYPMQIIYLEPKILKSIHETDWFFL